MGLDEDLTIMVSDEVIRVLFYLKCKIEKQKDKGFIIYKCIIGDFINILGLQ